MVTDKLQQVLNATACAVMNTHKHDRGLHHTVRHKLSDCTELRIALIMCCCLHGTAPEYTSLPLKDHLDTLDGLPATSSSFKLSIFGGHAFNVSGPGVLNSLPAYLKRPYSLHPHSTPSDNTSKRTILHVINFLVMF